MSEEERLADAIMRFIPAIDRAANIFSMRPGVREKEEAVSVEELARIFGMHKQAVREYCRMEGSPAWRTGTGEKAQWRCFPSKFEAFLLLLSKPYKG